MDTSTDLETSTDSASNVDIQGTKRGKCNKCNECKSFMVFKGRIRCEYCDHTPADHVRIIKLGACTRCNECKEYMPETEAEYSNCMYCDCPSSCHTGADELRKPKRPPSATPSGTPTASFSALSNSMSSGYSAKPPHLCIVPDCPYPKRVEGNKTHEFCSRTCAQKYQAFQSFDPSKVLQGNYAILVDSIQDADTLADSLYAQGVIAGNIREKVQGCRPTKKKNRALIAAVQQQVSGNPGSFQTFIKVLKMDKSNQTAVSLLTAQVQVQSTNT